MPLDQGAIVIEPIGWDELAERMKTQRASVLQQMHSGLRRIGEWLVPVLQADTPVGVTGHLQQRTTYQVTGLAEDMQCQVLQGAGASKGYRYGIGVRLGTRPHWPPRQALVPWVILKWGVTEKEAPGKAFVLARSISRKGTKPNPYAERVAEAQYPEVVRLMHEEINKSVKRLAQGSLL